MRSKIILTVILFALIMSCVSCAVKVSPSQNGGALTEKSGELSANDVSESVGGNESEEIDVNTEDNAEGFKGDNIQNEFDEVLSVDVSANYIMEKLSEAYELCDVAVIAEYAGDLETYADDVSGYPITVSEFRVNEVLKGNYEEETATIRYSGGVISVYESMQKIGEDTILKRGWDSYTEEEAKKIGFTLDFGEAGVDYSVDKDYLLLMYYDENADVEISHFRSEAIEGDSVYDEISYEYIKLSDLG